MNYLRNPIIELVLEANGDRVQELRDSRISLDGTVFPLLSDRLKYDLETLNNKIDNEIEYLKNFYSYYINIQSIGAVGDEETDNTELFSNFKKQHVYFFPKREFKTT